MDRKEYFDFVNIAKLILAIAIVAMHCALIPDYSLSMTYICRLGVPYFFTASGFFLQKKCKEIDSGKAVRGYIKRLFLPYVVFSVIWITQLLIDDAIQHVGFQKSAVSLIQYLVFYPRSALWYVWASILGVLMLYPFIRREKLLHALPLGIALFLVGLLANNYYYVAVDSEWLKPIVDEYLRICLVSNNAPFVGFVFLLIGMLICEYYDIITERIGVKVGVVILIISCALLALEDSYINNKAYRVGDGAFYLSQLHYVPIVFFLTTRVKCPHLSRNSIMTAKNLSTGIYFLHVPLLWILHRSAKYVFPHILGLSRVSPLFDHASVCFVCCLFLCLLICLPAYRRPKSIICKILK